MSLAEFRSQFLGGARPTLYKVHCPFPSGVDSGGASLKLSFDAKVAQIPGATVNPINVPYRGRNLKIAGDRDFQPITLQVINDVDWKVRTAFERWLNLINGHAENVGATRMSQYQVDWSIEQYDRNGLVLAKYDFVGGFPIDVSTIDLGYEQVDTISEFSVTMDYQWWTRAEVGIL